jgi:hypothetical protein
MLYFIFAVRISDLAQRSGRVGGIGAWVGRGK